MLMITTQYRYIAVKLEKLFRQENSEDESDSQKECHPRRTDLWAEKETKAICQHHNISKYTDSVSIVNKRLLKVCST